MANSEQAVKRVRQDEKKRKRQKGQLTAMRTAVNKVHQAVNEDADNVEELLKHAIKTVDKAAGKGLIHENKAAREKSRMQKRVNAQ